MGTGLFSIGILFPEYHFGNSTKIATKYARHVKISADIQGINTHMPKDAWRHDYVYRCPGTKDPNSYDLFSAGPDGKPDTADDDWGG